MKHVLLVNWDSYPNFASGGVYTWEKALIEKMSDWKFTIMNFLSNSNSNGNYTVPANVKTVIELPTYGSNRYEEFYSDTSNLFPKILRTKSSRIKKQFLPLFRDFLSNVISEKFDAVKFCDQVLELHNLFGAYDSKKCLEDLSTWETFFECIEADPVYKHMSMKSALSAFQMIQRNVQLLSVDVPKVDIIHCSLVWLPSLLGIVGKSENNCPLILTEHGVAFRELLLYYSAYLFDEPSKVFAKILSQNIVKALYSKADFIAPVCSANAVWEKMLGADESKIRIIYNGVDTQKFRPLPLPKPPRNPVIVYVGRVDSFKDIVCLVSAINIAKNEIPSLTCLIYGSSTDLEYSEKCVKVVNQLGLQDSIQFMGPINQPEKAYNLGDIVVSSSITEGFPFSVIEAMSCGKAVVATDVGGVREALDGCGILVKSRRPAEIADAIVNLLRNEKFRNDLGMAAMKRARQSFTLEQSIQNYRKLYEEALQRRGTVSIEGTVIAT
ncbi:MAG TPA: GT4 family glycosyltransferase PelF [Nitrososphaerales archaeon]|nr:GT4 family glycosyltransferase PelF [Nitrososphaerales archaeon]